MGSSLRCGRAIIRDNLDDYAHRFPVLIEDAQGNLWHAGEVRSGDYTDGPAVVIEMGERFEN